MAAEQPRPRRLPAGARTALIVAGAIVLLLLLIWGIRYIAYARSHQTTDDARVDADQVQITSKISERVARLLVDTNQAVHRGQVLIVLDDTDERNRLAQAIGNLNAQRAQAAAATANVALAQDVQAAQSEQGLGGVQSAQSNISGAAEQANAAQQQVPVTHAAAQSAFAQLQAAQAAVPGASQALAKAQADLARTSSLVTSGDIPRSQLDAARAAEEQARSQYNQTLAQVRAARAGADSAWARVSAQQAVANGTYSTIGAARGNLTTARGRLAESTSPNRIAAQQAQANAAYAAVANLDAQVRLARAQLANTRITSPVDGYVGLKNVETGQTVQPGVPLLTIVSKHHIFITANFKETQIGVMRNGQPVDIRVDAYKGVLFHGHLEAIGPAAQSTFSIVPPQNATGNFVKVTQRIPVRIAVDNPDPNLPLRPGMSVVASVYVR